MNNSFSLQPGTSLGEFILLEKLGKGGFGEVWKARHEVWDDHIVAVKIPTHPAAVEQLKKEGTLQHRISHPFAVKIFTLNISHAPPYLVMEFVEGGSLRNRMKEGRLPREESLRVLDQLFAVLEYAHSKGFIHRDLKPENVLLTKEGTVKLADFGLGKIIENTMTSLLQSGPLDSVASGPVMGTLAYMAPEQKSGESVDLRSDVFSLGVMIFELFTGVLPEGLELPSEIDPSLPEGFNSICRQAIARNPAHRYGSIGDLRMELLRTFHYTPASVAEREERSPPEIPLTYENIKRCDQCGVGLHDGDFFCDHCGDLLPPYEVSESPGRFCPACRWELAERESFCTRCGEKTW